MIVVQRVALRAGLRHRRELAGERGAVASAWRPENPLRGHQRVGLFAVVLGAETGWLALLVYGAVRLFA